MVGFVECFAGEVADFGAEFAVDEDAGGAIVEADCAGNEGSVALGGDERALDYERSDVAELARGLGQVLNVAIGVAEELGYGYVAFGDWWKRFAVQECAFADGGGVEFVEVGKEDYARDDLAIFEIGGGDAPKRLAVSEV